MLKEYNHSAGMRCISNDTILLAGNRYSAWWLDLPNSSTYAHSVGTLAATNATFDFCGPMLIALDFKDTLEHPVSYWHCSDVHKPMYVANS